jgi:hypothetical protein
VFVESPYSLVIELADALDVIPLCKWHGCWEYALDSHWWIAVNGHRVPVRTSHGDVVDSFTILVEYQGMFAGTYGLDNGYLMRGSEQEFLRVLTLKVADLQATNTPFEGGAMELPDLLEVLRRIEDILTKVMAGQCGAERLLGPLHEFTGMVFHKDGSLCDRPLLEWNRLGHEFRTAARWVIDADRSPVRELKSFEKVFQPLFALARAELVAA